MIVTRSSTATQIAPWVAPLLGAAVGWLSATHFAYMTALLAVAGFCLAFRFPPLATMVFWATYSLRTTVFAVRESLQGLYYPLYLLMAVNAGWRIVSVKRKAAFPLSAVLPYALFMATVLVGLVWQPAGLTVNPAQRLFIYSLGLLTALQMRSEEHRRALFHSISAVGIVIGVWTIYVAHSRGYGYRAGVPVNPNHIATLVALGLVPILAALAQGRTWRRLPTTILLWAALVAGTYASLLLASRGVTVALVVSCAVILLRRALNLRRTVSISLFALAAVLLVLNLPGSQGLQSRFAEESIASLNGRIPLWTAVLRDMASASPQALLMGHGMGSSEMVVRGVNPLVSSAHNAFIQIAYEYGAIGLASFVLLLTALLRSTARVEGLLGDIGVGILTLLAGSCLTATTADTFVFWISLGATIPTSSASQGGVACGT